MFQHWKDYLVILALVLFYIAFAYVVYIYTSDYDVCEDSKDYEFCRQVIGK